MGFLFESSKSTPAPIHPDLPHVMTHEEIQYDMLLELRTQLASTKNPIRRVQIWKEIRDVSAMKGLDVLFSREVRGTLKKIYPGRFYVFGQSHSRSHDDSGRRLFALEYIPDYTQGIILVVTIAVYKKEYLKLRHLKNTDSPKVIVHQNNYKDILGVEVEGIVFNLPLFKEVKED